LKEPLLAAVANPSLIAMAKCHAIVMQVQVLENPFLDAGSEAIVSCHVADSKVETGMWLIPS